MVISCPELRNIQNFEILSRGIYRRHPFRIFTRTSQNRRLWDPPGHHILCLFSIFFLHTCRFDMMRKRHEARDSNIHVRINNNNICIPGNSCSVQSPSSRSAWLGYKSLISPQTSHAIIIFEVSRCLLLHWSGFAPAILLLSELQEFFEWSLYQIIIIDKSSWPASRTFHTVPLTFSQKVCEWSHRGHNRITIRRIHFEHSESMAWKSELFENNSIVRKVCGSQKK